MMLQPAALDVLDAALVKFPEALPEGHWRVGTCLVEKGAALTALRRFETAETTLLSAQQMLESQLGPDHRRVREAIEALVALYERWPRPEQRQEWAARLTEKS